MEDSLVRIWTKNGGKPVGIGFLVDQQHLLTCAHVVTTALGLPLSAGRPTIDNLILCDFPLIDSVKRKRFTGEVVGWEPYQSTPTYRGDLACLRLHGKLPHESKPAQLKVKASLWQERFRAFGVPNGHPHGVWAEGEILGREANGYFQVETTRRSGYPIQPGFSGGPVWADKLGSVVALLALGETAPNIHSAFAIPARILIEFLDGLISNPLPVTNIETFGEVSSLNDSQVTQLMSQAFMTAHDPTAKCEDLLHAGIIALWKGQYQVAKGFLERLIQQDSLNAYAHYALVISLLEGKPPRYLQDFKRAKLILGYLEQSEVIPQINIMKYYIKYDYFKRNGFTAFVQDLNMESHLILNAVINKHEINSLKKLIPDIVNIPIWDQLA
jgi:hypothetical protein